MDITVLKNFLMVAQEENITRAAEILHISQPTLSRQIQSLEEEFGKQLFARNNKMVRLTSQGRLLQQRAMQIIELYEKTHTEINPRLGIVSGDVRIALSEATIVRAIFEVGKKFLVEYPMTRLRVLNGDNYTVINMIETGEVDFGLLFGFVDEKQFDSYRIAEEESIGVLMPAEHPLASREVLDVEDLKEYPLLMHQDSLRKLPMGFHNVFEGLDHKATFTMLVAAEKMVEAGMGIAVVTDSILNFESNGLVTRPFARKMSVPTFLAWKKNSILSPQADIFLEMLKEEL